MDSVDSRVRGYGYGGYLPVIELLPLFGTECVKSGTEKELRGELPPWLNTSFIRFMLERRLL